MVRVQTCENVQKPQPHSIAYIFLSYIIFIIYNHRNDSKDFSFQISDFTCFQILLRCHCILSSRNPPESLMSGRLLIWGRWKKSEQDIEHQARIVFTTIRAWHVL